MTSLNKTEIHSRIKTWCYITALQSSFICSG